MADRSLPAQDSVSAQTELFRRAEREHGLSITILAQRNHCLSPNTMRGWRDGAAMPAYALGELKTAGVPDELLSLIFKPFGVAFVSDPDSDDAALDTAALDALAFVAAVQHARDPRSPGGSAIIPQEKAIIHPLRQRAAASLRRARRA